MNIPTVIPLLIMGLKGWQLIIVLLLILLLFGAKRIPDIMRNLGKGIHAFKQGVEDIKKEANKPIEEDKKDIEKDK